MEAELYLVAYLEIFGLLLVQVQHCFSRPMCNHQTNLYSERQTSIPSWLLEWLFFSSPNLKDGQDHNSHMALSIYSVHTQYVYVYSIYSVLFPCYHYYVKKAVYSS